MMHIAAYMSSYNDKKFGQVCQQRMRCTLHRWDSMHLHLRNNSKIEININKTSFPFLVHFSPVELKQEYA